MLSDEEKKAIERLEDLLKQRNKIQINTYDLFGTIEIVLNLIEKQQKEIEELKNADLTTVYLNGFYDGEKKVKDKIKAKIEECENKIKKIRSKKLINEPEDTIIITRYAHYISVLQSLLEKE